MLTLSQALKHLEGIRRLCTAENTMLPCVREAVRCAKVDVLGDLRYDYVHSYKDIQTVKEAVKLTERLVDDFLKGDV